MLFPPVAEGVSLIILKIDKNVKAYKLRFQKILDFACYFCKDVLYYTSTPAGVMEW
jgi:hypothetical protein